MTVADGSADARLTVADAADADAAIADFTAAIAARHCGRENDPPTP